MRIQEILLESYADDRVIIDAAQAITDRLIKNYESLVYPHLFGPLSDPRDPHAGFGDVHHSYPDLRYINDPVYKKLGQTNISIDQVPNDAQALASRSRDKFVIFLNYKYFKKAGRDISSLSSWLTDTLSHELRHVLDYIKRDASTSKKKFDFNKSKYYQNPHIEDEPDSTQSEVNAYFTQLLHQVEADLKHNNITDVNRALKFAQDSLEESQLAEVIFGGWDSNNPVLRRLSARMAQFVHNLYQQ